MGKYMITGRYTAEGTKGLMKDGGTGRRDAATALIEGVGGSVEALYFAYGKDDIVVIVDAPDDESMTAAALTVGASGLVGIRTTVLLTPEQIDAAVEKSPAYRPPGG